MFEDFYGLAGKPFQLTPDPAFYFESATHRKALSYLAYGMAQAEGFIVITGEVGAGKSTLVAHLMATIDHDRLTAGQIVTSKLDGSEIIHVVAQAFGLDIEGHDKASALGAIEGFLHEEARAGRRCLLVVDESQNLAVEALEELRMLSNFQLGSHPLLQTLLLGQPEFRATLQGHPALEQLRQRVIAAHHLEAMERDEVEAYVHHRLSLVGWNGNPSFDQRVFAMLHEVTGGIPRRLNQVMNRLLLLGAVERRSRIDTVMLEAVLDEMANDHAVPGPVPAAQRQAEPMASHATPVAGAAPEGFALGPKLIDDALAERDAQIAELQQAVLELAAVQDVAWPQLEVMAARVDKLETRLMEQDRIIRHTLTMLIEWIESGEAPRVAA